ncbi:MAG TPA: dUTP diphosphatase [Solirubrobacterales bacterium]|nr:dUTP diphosphatase [Solirubrobacterales bacterium]
MRIARTGYSFARGFLPPSRTGSQTWSSTERGEGAGYPPAEAYERGLEPLDTSSEPVLTDPDALGTESDELNFIKLGEHAILPTRAHDSDAGLDLYAAEAASIAPGGRVSVGTALAMAVPEGLAGLVLPRSGLALKSGVTLVNSPGLIDPGYRGEVRVLLLNTDRTREFHVKPGDRIAQLLLVPFASTRPLQAEALDESTRGAGGFGSTGF